MTVMATEPMPLQMRIEFCEAVIELEYAKLAQFRSDSFDGRKERKKRWVERIDPLLDELSLMHAERDGITIPDALTDSPVPETTA